MAEIKIELGTDDPEEVSEAMSDIQELIDLLPKVTIEEACKIFLENRGWSVR